MAARVIVLEDCADLRMLMSQLVKVNCNEDCLAVSSFDELLEHEAETLRSDIIFLDINLGEGCPSGIDAYHWLRQKSYTGKVYFFTGHARNHPVVAKADNCSAEVLEKPVKATVLVELINHALSAGRPS